MHGEFLLVATVCTLELLLEPCHSFLMFGKFLPVSNVTGNKDSTLFDGGKDSLNVLFV